MSELNSDEWLKFVMEANEDLRKQLHAERAVNADLQRQLRRYTRQYGPLRTPSGAGGGQFRKLPSPR